MSHSSDKVTFANAEDHELAGRLEMPPVDVRTYAIFAHCFTCGKDIAAASRISRALTRRGIGVLRFDFTGLGSSEGDFANTNFASNVDDLVAAAAYLRASRRAPTLLVGHSLGGAAVLMAADRVPEVRAVATLAAPSQPEHLQHLLAPLTAEIEQRGEAQINLGGKSFRIRQQFLDDLKRHDVERDTATLKAALLVLHSPQDEIVDIDHARRIFQAAPYPKGFLSLDGMNHLVSRREDAEYVADVLAAWSSRYL